MRRLPWKTAAMLAVTFVGTSIASAATVPFVEDFSSDVANWKDAIDQPLLFQAAGGPDGSSYATTAFSFSGNAAGDNQTIFRGHDAFDSSGDAFVGNWIADGVGTLRAMVRHDAPVPVSYFARLAPSTNFPGAIAIQFAPVLPNVWTPLSFEISASSPQLFYFEGGDFASIFSQMGNIQFGATVPDSLAGSTTSFTFDLDQVAIARIPEPAAVGLGLVCLMGWALRRVRTR